MAKICSAKRKIQRLQKQNDIFSKNNILENALIQLPFSHTHVFDSFEEEEEKEDSKNPFYLLFLSYFVIF